MERWKKDNRTEVTIVDLEGLVPKDHLLRKIEKLMDYEWIPITARMLDDREQTPWC